MIAHFINIDLMIALLSFCGSTYLSVFNDLALSIYIVSLHFNPTYRSTPLWLNHKLTSYLISYSMNCARSHTGCGGWLWYQMMQTSWRTHPWDWLAKRCPRAYILIVKIVLKPCGTLWIITYHHAPQLMFTTAHSINSDPMIALSFWQLHSLISIQ